MNHIGPGRVNVDLGQDDYLLGDGVKGLFLLRLQRSQPPMQLLSLIDIDRGSRVFALSHDMSAVLGFIRLQKYRSRLSISL